MYLRRKPVSNCGEEEFLHPFASLWKDVGSSRCDLVSITDMSIIFSVKWPMAFRDDPTTKSITTGLWLMAAICWLNTKLRVPV